MWDPARLRHRQFARVSDLVDRIAGEPDWPTIDRLNAAFAPELGDLRLVEATKTRPTLARDGTIDPLTLYEVRIVERFEIPTRPRNAHDLLNALIWAAFPRSKLALTRALAAIQRERAAGRATLPTTRTRAHDRLALVDEGALLCVGATQWIFGHAILEHAYAGELAVRGSAVDLSVDLTGLDPVAARAAVDHAFATAELERVVRSGPGIPVDC